ncbi:MAG: glycine cleavage system protein GcvH [Gammaproteobacteria bacterium]|nr:glycine cleavage system protein GcvH [Gammaproteobacteria bacterium]MCP5459982.1 glycine cleavage system protein GcvH [Gammaproteobacteria bacterium]
MSAMKYTEDHEWLRLESGDTAVVGITHHAQEQLGDLVYVELPTVGSEVSQGVDSGTIESVKAASELKAPASGTVVEINEALVDDPGLANKDPTGEGWFIKIKLSNPSELEALMDQAAYDKLLEELNG